MSKFFLTTPIYYVNDIPHIGHAYTSILADVFSRWNRLKNNNVFFLTGTDEHGQKVKETAEKLSRSPKEHVDITSEKFRDMNSLLNISNDYFIRTTDTKHIEFVQYILTKLYNSGYIYKEKYSGLYNIKEEQFYTEQDIRDGIVSIDDCQLIEEENYFFRMSLFQTKLISHITNNPDFIYPQTRQNEILGFLKKPLKDLCISRPKAKLDWGVEIPFDSNFVTYVWVDALFNYISANESAWPATVQFIGKDILTTHAVYWTTLLMASGYELPKTIVAHGWWLSNGEKMSKSIGNVVDPKDIVNKYDVDLFRYFLMKDMVVGLDSSFSEESFKQVCNSDLSNNIGNLCSRISKLTITNFGGVVNKPKEYSQNSINVVEEYNNFFKEYSEVMNSYKTSVALSLVVSFSKTINKYLEDTKPWIVCKDETKKNELEEILYMSSQSLVCLGNCLRPFIPNKMDSLLNNMVSGNTSFVFGENVLFIKEQINLFPKF